MFTSVDIYNLSDNEVHTIQLSRKKNTRILDPAGIDEMNSTSHFLSHPPPFMAE